MFLYMNLKHDAALYALDLVENGMRLGLGTGSTTKIFIELLAEKLKSGGLKNIIGIPTSQETALFARSLDIPMRSLSDLEPRPHLLDLAVDGADEIDPNLDLIKGLGKAMLREKIVEIHASWLVIIADEGKMVKRLGRGPLPVEIVPFEVEVTLRWLNTQGCRAELWRDADGKLYITDNGNYLARCWFSNSSNVGIPDAYLLAERLAARPGIVEHGLFLGMTHQAIVAGQNGVEVLYRTPVKKSGAM